MVLLKFKENTSTRKNGCKLSFARPFYPGLRWEESCQRVKGGDPSPLLSTSEATSGRLGPVPGSPVQKGHGLNRVGPVKDHKDDEGTGAPLLEGKAESRHCSPLGKRRLGADLSVYKSQKGFKRTEPGCFRCCLVPGQTATGTNWKQGDPSGHQAALLCCARG